MIYLNLVYSEIAGIEQRNNLTFENPLQAALDTNSSARLKQRLLRVYQNNLTELYAVKSFNSDKKLEEAIKALCTKSKNNSCWILGVDFLVSDTLRKCLGSVVASRNNDNLLALFRENGWDVENKPILLDLEKSRDPVIEHLTQVFDWNKDYKNNTSRRELAAIAEFLSADTPLFNDKITLEHLAPKNIPLNFYESLTVNKLEFLSAYFSEVPIIKFICNEFVDFVRYTPEKKLSSGLKYKLKELTAVQLFLELCQLELTTSINMCNPRDMVRFYNTADADLTQLISAVNSVCAKIS